jgi:hypothetical protein
MHEMEQKYVGWGGYDLMEKNCVNRRAAESRMSAAEKASRRCPLVD